MNEIYIKRFPDSCGYLPGCVDCPVSRNVTSAPLERDQLSLDAYRQALTVLLGIGPVYRHSEKYSKSDVEALKKQRRNPRNISCNARRLVGVAMR